MAAGDGNIKVFCRLRPLMVTERSRGDPEGLLETRDEGAVVANQPLHGAAASGGMVKRVKFSFDGVFDVDTTQEEVFDQAARTVVEGKRKPHAFSPFLSGLNAYLAASVSFNAYYLMLASRLNVFQESWTATMAQFLHMVNRVRNWHAERGLPVFGCYEASIHNHSIALHVLERLAGSGKTHTMQ
jgi:hypothetical protein